MKGDQQKWTILKIIRYVVFTAILSIALVKIVINSFNSIEVKNDFLVTTGRIVEYKVFGVGNNRYRWLC